MLVRFLGVGESYDTALFNSSVAIQNDSNLLIDIGVSIPAQVEKLYPDPNFFDVVYFSHCHADHCFGMPGNLYNWNRAGRTKPLTIIAAPELKEKLLGLMAIGAPDMLDRLKYKLDFIGTTDPMLFRELSLSFAPTQHSVPNYAIKVKTRNGTIAVSGDGKFTDDSIALYRDCEILVHEARTFELSSTLCTPIPGLIQRCAELKSLRKLCLVHIDRDDRRNRRSELQRLGAGSHFQVLIPSPGDAISLN
jgi:ribonuclease Z